MLHPSIKGMNLYKGFIFSNEIDHVVMQVVALDVDSAEQAFKILFPTAKQIKVKYIGSVGTRKKDGLREKKVKAYYSENVNQLWFEVNRLYRLVTGKNRLETQPAAVASGRSKT